MRYFASREFDTTLSQLPEGRKKRIKKALALSVCFFETGSLPGGLGLKKLAHELWEVRAGLEDRVLFKKMGDTVQFLLVGNHDEIRRYLKEY